MGLIQDALAVSPLALIGDYQRISLTIQEITGSERRTVTLRDTAMPLDKLSGGIKNRVSVRDYFGSSRRSLHATGFNPVPTSFSGVWMYPHLLDRENEESFIYNDKTNGTIYVTNPTQARELMSVMAKSGQTVRVSWTAPDQGLYLAGSMSLPNSASYEGLFTGFTWDEEKWSHIAWNIEFEWEKESVFSSTLPILPATVNPGNVLSMLNNLTKQLKGLANGVLSDINGLIDGALGYVTFATNTIEDATEIAEGFANLPAEAATKVVDKLISAKDAVDGIAFAANNVAATYTGVADSWNALTTDTTAWDYLFNDKDEATPTEQVQSAMEAHQVRQAVQTIDYELARQLRKARQALAAQKKDIYIEASQGDSYRKWASRYFNDAGKWLAIAMANGEFQDVIEIGRTYRIPMSEASK